MSPEKEPEGSSGASNPRPAPPSRWAEALRGVLRALGRHELASILAWCGVTLGALLFAKLASEVTEGDTQHIDRALLLALRNPANLADPIGPRWLEQVGRDFSALGGPGVLTLLTISVVGYLALRRKPRAALFVA